MYLICNYQHDSFCTSLTVGATESAIALDCLSWNHHGKEKQMLVSVSRTPPSFYGFKVFGSLSTYDKFLGFGIVLSTLLGRDQNMT